MPMSQSAYAAPVERIAAIDRIRGLCLLGILIVNIQSYTLLDFLPPRQIYAMGLDKPSTYMPLLLLLRVFIHGQFFTIYSFLFGLGFYMMLEKNRRLGLNGTTIYIRRLLVLLFFGCVHAFVLWFGDILTMYAVFGFTLIYFCRLPASTLYRWIIGLAVGAVVVDVFRAIFFPLPPAHPEAFLRQGIEVLQHGSFVDIMRQQRPRFLRMWSGIGRRAMSGFMIVEIMFLFGLIAGKTGFFRRIMELRPWIRRRIQILVVPALALKILSCLSVLEWHVLGGNARKYENLLLAAASFFGTIGMALVYIGSLSLFFGSRQAKGRVTWLEVWIGNAGRLGLTNYLGQTILCMLLFYPYALGLIARLSLWESFLPILGIYSLQLFYSTLWLRHHKLGPMEGLWRRWTYLKSSAGGKTLS